MLTFASDFKPDIFIEGGDNVDCGPVSHWLKDKTKSSSELRLRKDFSAYNDLVVKPIDTIMAGKRKPLPNWAGKGGRKRKLTGNHEAWLDQLIDKQPQLEGLIELDSVIDLSSRGWHLFELGDVTNIGSKLHFTHGESIGGEHVAKQAVMQYEASIRLGHHHTFQIYTKHSPISALMAKTGVAVPCLANREPNYARKKPNRWLKGFNYGYVWADGTFADFTPIVISNRFAAEGKIYQG